MAVGGQTNQQDGSSGGGGVLDTVSQYWPALNRALQTNQALTLANQGTSLANQQKEMDVGQNRAQMSYMSGIAGGYDPQTKITWDGPSADPSKNPLAYTGASPTAPGAGGQPAAPNAASPGGPLASMMQDPLAQTVMRLDPKGTLSTIVSRAFAPPQTYQVTGPDGQARSQLLTPSQAMNMQSQGYQIAASDPAKPVDPNTVPTHFDVPVNAPGGPRNQTMMWQAGQGTRPLGALGDFTVKAPSGDLGQLADLARFNAFGGGGAMLPNHQGSGAPNNGTPPAASPVTQAGSGVLTAPVSNPAASGTTQPNSAPIPSWQQAPIPSPSSPAPNPGAVPTVADIVRSKMETMARTPEQQAALTRAAEIQAAETTNKPIEASKAEGAFNNHLVELRNLRANAQAAIADPNSAKNFGKWGIIPNMPGGDAANASTKLDTVRNQSILNVMQSARDMSQTGASGIRLMQTELPIFQNAIGNLSSSQSWDHAKGELQRIVDFTNQEENTIRQEFKQNYGRDLNFPGSGSSGSTGGWKIERAN